MFNIFQKVNHNGGITIDKKGSEYKGKGYAVAVSKDLELVIDESLFIPELIDQVIKHYGDKLNRDRVFLGIWKEAGKVYFDLSEVVTDKDQAIELGKERNQLAIFDFSSLEVIDLKGE